PAPVAAEARRRSQHRAVLHARRHRIGVAAPAAGLDDPEPHPRPPRTRAGDGAGARVPRTRPAPDRAPEAVRGDPDPHDRRAARPAVADRQGAPLARRHALPPEAAAAARQRLDRARSGAVSEPADRPDDADEALLAEVFDLLFEHVLDGRTPDFDQLVPNRP